MKFLRIFILFIILWITNLLKYFWLFKHEGTKSKFNQDFIKEYYYVRYLYVISLTTTILNFLTILAGICIKEHKKTHAYLCNIFIIVNVIWFYLINIVVLNLFREALNQLDDVDSFACLVYLQELLCSLLWIIFLLWVYVQINGRYEGIRNKFKTFFFGIIGIIFFLSLDIEVIIVQIYICIVYQIINNDNTYLYFILILLLGILQIVYVGYYVHKQIFQIYGAATIEFYRYSQFKKLSLGILLYTIVFEFSVYNSTVDLLYMFFVYGSIRLCNLRTVERLKEDTSLLSNQFTTLNIANQTCSTCNKEFTYLDKVVQNLTTTYHSKCYKQLRQQINNECYWQINLRYSFYDSEKQHQFRLNLFLIFITTLDYVYYIIHSCLKQNYHLQDVSLQIVQILIYSVVIILSNSLKKQIRICLLSFAFLSYYIHLYWLYSQLKIYDEIESTVFAIIQNILLITIQSTNLLMMQQVYYPIINFRKAFIIYFLRTLTINQVVYVIFYTYYLYHSTHYWLILSQVPIELYFALYLIYYDILSVRKLFQVYYVKPYLYEYHYKLSQMFLIILSIQQLYYQLFQNDDYVKDIHLKFKYFLFGCIFFTFRINAIKSQNYLKEAFKATRQQRNLVLIMIEDFRLIYGNNCQLCKIPFNDQDIIIKKFDQYYHKKCTSPRDVRYVKIWIR